MPDKVTGRAKFGIDASCRAWCTAPCCAGRRRARRRSASTMPRRTRCTGVTDVVPLPWGVGVVGTGYEAVQKRQGGAQGRRGRRGPAATYDSERIRGDYAGRGGVAVQDGRGRPRAGRRAERPRRRGHDVPSGLRVDHVYHATMEPMNAVARRGAGRQRSAEVWVPTQAPVAQSARHRGRAARSRRTRSPSIPRCSAAASGGGSRTTSCSTRCCSRRRRASR